MAFPSSGVINYWRLDESSGNAVDAVGGNTLTNSGVSYGTGKINNGAVYNNTNIVLTGSGPAFGTAGSISLWEKITTGDDGGYFFDASSANRYYMFYGNDGSGGCSLNGAGGPTISAGAFVFNQYNHVVLTWDNSLGSNKIALYINGTLYGNSNNAISASTPTNFYIGNRFSNTGTPDDMQGTLDEIGVWNRALSSTEVTDLYNGGSGISYPVMYALAAGTGTFALTGVGAGFLYNRIMSATVGSFALTGIDSVLRRGFGFIASAGSFVLTGIDATLRLRAWTYRSKSASTFTTANKTASSWTFNDKS